MAWSAGMRSAAALGARARTAPQARPHNAARASVRVRLVRIRLAIRTDSIATQGLRCQVRGDKAKDALRRRPQSVFERVPEG